MGYVEFLRAQHAFVRFAVVLTFGVAFTVFSAIYGINHAHGFHHVGNGESSTTISIGNDRSHGAPPGADDHELDLSSAAGPFSIPMGLVFGIAAYLAIGFGTILGTSLNKENGRGGFAFVKPIARERLALTYFAVDLTAILAIFAYAVILAFASFAALGVLGHVAFEPGCWMVLGIGLGAAAMWYGILQAATAMRLSGGGLFVGLSWATFTLGLPFFSITYFGPIFHDLIAAIDFFNPLAYFGLHSGVGDSGGAGTSIAAGPSMGSTAVVSLFGFGEPVILIITWGIALLAFAAAVYGWKRVEV